MITRPNFSALFAASPYPYLLIDTGFVIIGANPAYLAATGRTADDIVGKQLFDAFPPNPSDPDSTNVAEVRASIASAIATRKPHTSALLRYAVPRATPEGTVFEQRYWSAMHSPVFDDAGEVVFVSQNAIDVTDLYRFDAATRKYYLKQDANAVPDIPQMNRPQMHEAMTRILDAERSQLQVLFDQAPGFIAVMTGKDHTFEMVNEAFYGLVGHRLLVGTAVIDALPELTGQGFKELLDNAFETGKPVVLRERKISVQRRPGSPLDDRYVDLLFQPVIGQNGRVTGIFAQGSDVTGAYQANLALSEKIQQLEEIQSRQAFQLELADRLRPLDDPGEITGAACALLGQRLGVSRVLYSEIDDVRGRFAIPRDWTGGDLPSMAGYAGALDDFGPEVIAELRAGQPVLNHDVARDPRTAAHCEAYEQVGIRADLLLPLVKGGRLQVVLALHSAAPRRWTLDETALAREMAERTWSAVEAARAHASLRNERDESQYIFDSMAEGFALLDRDWSILRMNAEGLRLTQRDASEVIGHDHWDVWPELKGTDTEAVFLEVMETGKSAIVEVAHVLPDQTRMRIETRAHRSLGGGIAFFFRDISERHAAQEQLQLADRRKDEFLAMLAHELRNPLAPIGAAAQLLQMGRLDEARVRQTSQIIGRQVDHMTHLINDLLDVSRVTRELVTLDSAPLDMRDVVAEAVEQVTPLIQARRHQLALHLSPAASTVMGDGKRLVQVVTNILANAAKYTDAGGMITLTMREDGSQVVLDVTDDGIGMSADLAGHAFDLFAQAERISDRSAGGLGLGLALVRSLTELHGGTVSCRSAGLGQGSTFTVRLPRLVAPQGAAAHVQDDAAARSSGKALRILIVDDNIDAAAMLAMLLEASGHEVMVEHDARAGLARAEAQAPAVCLLDIGLPGMDGNALARRLRLLPATRHAVLVAATGYGQESDRRLSLAAGFDHHLVKPLDTKKLFEIIETARLDGNPGVSAA